jgi:branched-chain amino acid transport system permease protein
MSLLAFAYQFADSFAFLVLCASGLAIVFGMMGVINLAHGDFIMVGAYVTVFTAHAGLPLPLAMACGTVAAGAIGLVLERLVIRHLYGRPFDSIVATWAISLIAGQGMLIIAGPTMPSIGTPFGSFALGGVSFATYRLVFLAAALGELAAIYALFVHTRYGIYARATIQRPDIAGALGLDTARVYAATFGLGAALAGLTGALYAPTMSLVPTMGTGFVVQAFVTVVVGGGDVLLGTAPAAAILGAVQAWLTAQYGTLVGKVGLLLAVIFVVRAMPKGISGWIGSRRS